MDEVKIVGEVAKTSPKRQQVFGYAYVAYDKNGTLQIDKSGERIPTIEEMENMAYKFVLNSRTGSDSHSIEKRGVSTLIESIVFTPEKFKAMGIPAGTLPIGWWVGFQVHDDQVWKSFEAGDRKMFSIHGKGKRVKAV